MKIAICGSINKSDELIKIANELEKLGFEAELPYWTKRIRNGDITLEEFCNSKEKHGDAAFRKEAQEDLYKRYWRIIGESDAILVVNVDKSGIKNYIGGNALMEIGFAYIQNKKIFLLNDIPDIPYYKDEIIAAKPIILEGDLTKIL